MVETLLGVTVALLGVLTVRTFLRPPTASPPPQNDIQQQQIHQLAVLVAALKTQVDGLPSLWETESKRASRDRAAAEQAERRRRKRLEDGDDPTDEPGFIHAPLHLGDGAASGGAQLRPVRAGVETPESIRAAALEREAQYERMLYGR